MKTDIARILNDVHDHRLPVAMAVNEIMNIIEKQNLPVIEDYLRFVERYKNIDKK